MSVVCPFNYKKRGYGRNEMENTHNPTDGTQLLGNKLEVSTKPSTRVESHSLCWVLECPAKHNMDNVPCGILLKVYCLLRT